MNALYNALYNIIPRYDFERAADKNNSSSMPGRKKKLDSRFTRAEMNLIMNFPLILLNGAVHI